MTIPRRRTIVLIGVLLAVLMGFVVLRPFGEPTTGAGPAGTAASRSAQAKAEASVPDVRLDLLRHDEGTFQTPERNPFTFGRRETPVVAPAGPPRPRRVVEVPPEPTGPPPEPPLPPIPLRYIGFMQPTGDSRIAMLSDGRGTVIPGKEGDVIEGRYRLLRVGSDSADLVYLDGRGRQTIRLSGQ
ncbi:MAG TPA: hypothetical protein VKB50_22220 [Vicinamibacterales bacterium]|nr:hypothetical protein [Vicinamibacterales bacterium]